MEKNLVLKLSDYSWNEPNNDQSIKKFVDLPWEWACHRRNFEIICHLVQYDSASINYQNSLGISLLMIAAADRLDSRGVRLLHESGAQIGLRDREGRMALHFAANSGNVELLQYILKHTDSNCIEQWFMNIPNVLQEKGILHSLVGCAIHSRNVECLEILLSSSKLSKSILQAPVVQENNNACSIYSPLAYVFSTSRHFTVEQLNSYLQLLLKHKVTMLDEFSRAIIVKWPDNEINYWNPFSMVFSYWPFTKQQHYFDWLNENDVTIDYCLRCFHDNDQPFSTFTNYQHYYKPVLDVLTHNNLKGLKLIMSNSAILEPDELIIQFNKVSEDVYYLDYYTIKSLLYGTQVKDVRQTIYEYLISLKPIYYKIMQLCEKTSQNGLSWYPYSTVGEEFSKSTLQQLCRTTIRHHIREDTLAGNLHNFRKNILELPLPPVMKRFLLFES